MKSLANLHRTHPMPINVNNPEADSLTRTFAAIAGVGITEAITIAMREAIDRRRADETPRETAARLRAKYGLDTGKCTRQPLREAAWDAMWEDTPARPHK